jgi:hypothetical protein
MLHPLISAFIFLVASVSTFIAAVVSVFNESSLDTVYLVTSLICSLLSLAMFRSHKRGNPFRSH